MQNISISGGATVISKSLGAVSTIILARLLSPIDFSIVGISMVLIGFVNQFSDMGFYAAVVQKKDKIEEAQYTGFFLRLFLSIAVVGILFFIAPYWARFYETREITNVVRVSLISILVAPFSFIPATYFLRTLNFKKSAVINITRNITYILAAISIAFAGLGYWSIVWGTVLGSIISVIVACVMHPWKIRFKFDIQVAKELFKFGKYILVSGLLLFLIGNMDNMVVGKVVTMTVLGFYVMAFRWGMWVKDNLARVVGNVMFPTFSKIQDDKDRLKRAYLHSLKYFSMVIFPASFGLMLLAPEFTTVVLGEKWIPAIVPMQILCVAGLCQALSVLDRDIVNSKGMPKINAKLDVTYLIILGVVLYPLVKLWGAVGGSIAVLITALTIKIAQLFIVKQIMKIRLKEIYESWLCALISSVVMIIMIIITRRYLNSINTGDVLRFISLFFIGFTTYFSVIFLLAKKDLVYLWQNLKRKDIVA
jgi:O-antigen/teichoic acid export membrane protein